MEKSDVIKSIYGKWAELEDEYSKHDKMLDSLKDLCEDGTDDLYNLEGTSAYVYIKTKLNEIKSFQSTLIDIINIVKKGS